MLPFIKGQACPGNWLASGQLPFSSKSCTQCRNRGWAGKQVILFHSDISCAADVTVPNACYRGV